jgi:flagellar FliL protein
VRKNIVIIALVVVLVGAGVGYKMTRPKDTTRKKVDGTVYVLPKDFLVNLRDGRYAKLDVALVLDKSQSTAAAGGKEGATPPDGFGTLPEEAVVRDIVTDVVTGQTGQTLIDAAGRERIKQEILDRIRRTTDVRTKDVLLTDVAVQ